MSNFPARLRQPEVPDWRLVYALVFLTTFTHAILSWGAWKRLPARRIANRRRLPTARGATPGGRARTAILMEAMTAMVFLAPGLYNRINEEGIREGIAKVRAEAMEKRIADAKREGFAAGFAEGFAASFVEGFAKGERAERERIAAALDAAGITDPETRRIVMNGQRNGQ